jgi:hypothetical protein
VVTIDLALDFRVLNAVEWVADPHAGARAYNAELIKQGNRPMDDLYPFAMGEARAIIRSLLDVIGVRDHGPTRFDCEWALAHPYVDDDAGEIEFDDGDLLDGLRAEVAS